MHLPDGVLDPRICLLTSTAAAGTVGYCAWQLTRVGQKALLARPMHLALVGAGVFAAQAFNFPLGAAASGHILGGALAGALLGPWAGVVVVSLVLLVQCLAFGDGGITALGANVLNMAVLGPWFGHLAVSGTKRLSLGKTVELTALGGAAALSVVLGATSCGMLLAASSDVALDRALQLLLGPHLAIGVAEGVFTAAVVAIVAWASHTSAFARTSMSARPALLLGGVLFASAVAALLASTLPDGLEVALLAERLTIADAAPSAAPLALAVSSLLGALCVYMSTLLTTRKLTEVVRS